MDAFVNFLGYLAVFVVGLGVGIYAARFVVKREFEKNPPISEDMIAAMLKSMGQPASKKRVAQVTKSMKAAGQKSNKKKK